MDYGLLLLINANYHYLIKMMAYVFFDAQKFKFVLFLNKKLGKICVFDRE